jgi:UDP-N-acetylglucosamine--N-acetylmuramyl-(pentapeptide) pyrophosphoryl-undecaprenol N-acetylglucosamine transferase
MTKIGRILIMAGGTGGHVFPGLAIAKQLQEKGIIVHWLGTMKGLEARLVPDAGIPIYFISISGLRGKSLKDLILAPWRLFYAILQAIRIIRTFNPDVVIGLGGFASGPGGIASWLLRRPLIIHEQNAKKGMTNRWLARIAHTVLEAFPETFSNRQAVITTGNPVRKEIASLPFPRPLHQPLHLLVVGGSLGAQAINALVPVALSHFKKDQFEVTHQTGEKHFEQTRDHYAALGINAHIVSFISEMDKAYAWADVVICRAGALTIAELCAAGLGALLVPYPHAVDDHQTANAHFMVKHHAALMIQQADLTVEKLVQILKEFKTSPESCVAMAKASYQLRKVDATDQIVALCEELMN